MKTINNLVPCFFLVTERYNLGTPKGIAASKRTFDVPFDDFAFNIDLQEELKLGCSVFARPDVSYATPLVGQELRRGVAVFLAAFSDDPEERQRRRDYLLNNGTVRIRIKDEKLLEELNLRKKIEEDI